MHITNPNSSLRIPLSKLPDDASETLRIVRIGDQR